MHKFVSNWDPNTTNASLSCEIILFPFLQPNGLPNLTVANVKTKTAQSAWTLMAITNETESHACLGKIVWMAMNSGVKLK